MDKLVIAKFQYRLALCKYFLYKNHAGTEYTISSNFENYFTRVTAVMLTNFA